MKKLYVLCTLLLVCCAIFSQNLKPVQTQVGKLHISVDPRIELLSVVQNFSTYPLINRSIEYNKEILEYFKDYSSLSAVQLTNSLYRQGFSYDAPVAFMLHLSSLLELKKITPYSDYLIGRSNGAENLDNYRESLYEFAKKVAFEEFWNKNRSFYEDMIRITVADMPNIDLVKELEDYLNEKKKSYNIILSPSFRPQNYGTSIYDKGENIYSINSTHLNENGIPYLSGESMLYLVWHEFGHSFINPLTDRYIEKVNSFSKLMDPIREDMERQAYPKWNICLYEHIVRAVVIRLLDLHTTTEISKKTLKEEQNNSFIYIEPIVNKLKEFETLRDREGITFTDFYPQLLDIFSTTEVINIAKEGKKFSGPINNVYRGAKLAWIYPTQGNNSSLLLEMKSRMEKMSQHIQSVTNPNTNIVISDSTALVTSLSDYNIITFGTFENNLFLAKHKKVFPFGVEKGTLYADKKYIEKDIKLISCLPNFENPQNGLLIYTALSEEGLENVNDVHHGGEDYIIFQDRNTILNKGFYNKEEDWVFP